MSFRDKYVCDRCKKEILGNSVLVTFTEVQEELNPFKQGLDLCSACFLGFIDWVKNSEPTKMGQVERVARRMNE